METDRYLYVRKFLGEAVRAKSDPVGKVGRLQNERLKIPGPRNSHALGINILGSFFAFSESTFGSIGVVNGVTKQRVHQIINETLQQIWEHSPKKLRYKYPNEKLFFGQMEKLAGNSYMAFELSVQGKGAIEIRDELARNGIGSYEQAKVRTNLKRRGIEVAMFFGEGLRITEKLKKSKTDDERKVLLYFIGKRVQLSRLLSETGAVVSVAKACKEYGLHVRHKHTKRVFAVLKSSGIPVGKMEYKVNEGKNSGVTQRFYFFAAQDEERVGSILRKDQRLDKFRKNPVVRVCGPRSGNPPTLWECMKLRGVRLVRESLEKFDTSSIGKVRKAFKTLLTHECPVTVYRTQVGYVCREEDVPRFEEYVGKRLAELGSVS